MLQAVPRSSPSLRSSAPVGRRRARAGGATRLRALLALAAAGCLVGAGCAGFQIRSDYDRQADFSAYRTFAWLEPPIREPQELPEEVPANEVLLRNSLLDKRLRSAVSAALERRGLERVPDAEADLMLRYRVAVDERTEFTGGTIGTGFYYGRYPWYVSPGLDTYWSSRNIVDGILILDMVDAETGQLVWRGWAVGRNPDAYFREEEIEEAVAGLMRQFPPERDAED